MSVYFSCLFSCSEQPPIARAAMLSLCACNQSAPQSASSSLAAVNKPSQVGFCTIVSTANISVYILFSAQIQSSQYCVDEDEQEMNLD